MRCRPYHARVLWSEKKRIEETAAREAAGEDLWTEEIPYAARVKIAAEWRHLAESDRLGYRGEQKVEEAAKAVLERFCGSLPNRVDPEQWRDTEDTDTLLTQLGAVLAAFHLFGVDTSRLEKRINGVFNSHRVAFRVVDKQFIPFHSDELHVEVVEPTLRLLVDSRFAGAHASYLKALKEISSNDPADAITDAGTALREAFAVLGYEGNSLGAQLKDAKKQGVLAPHDRNLADGIAKFIDWASADRSEMGDAHKHSHASAADAWLMVHVVGALIVRLADPRHRSGPGEPRPGSEPQ